MTTEVPESNTTSLGLYVTPREAYAMWQADPDGVHILDVRTFEEYVFGGHVEAAKNVPLVFPSSTPKGRRCPAGRPGCSGDPNPDFVAQGAGGVRSRRHDPRHVRDRRPGRDGGQRTRASGFTNVYNIVNGFEGDRVDDPGSVFHGKHMRNGWKNAGLPWGYDFHPDLMWVAAPEQEPKELAHA